MRTDPALAIKIRRRAAELVEAGWVRMTFATDALNRPTEPERPEAAHWCAHGAIARAVMEVLGVPVEAVTWDVVGQVRRELRLGERGTLAAWNDEVSRRPEEVVAALRGWRDPATKATKATKEVGEPSWAP